ncbi:ABC transporter permease [Cuneatibacter sp. NSJ-177]|jgi:peptide/nickel transport system permease protein|uniref:nickel transporter permease n=1 Tax=Cuneatibacter sp. NSJ-177 TaxID=2931401 RepID=UPI001FCF88EB|nr:nickel transporter permease [Cuneatibacter sp. NSJ-177]MCJ7836219.1 ABC transporter permease [Cuneatibacter sp. NSJ-177]
MNRLKTALKPRIHKWRTNFYLLRKNKLTFLSLLFIILLVVVAIFAPLLAPHPEHIMEMTNPSEKLLPPSGEYWFGTDELGRDIFSRILYGTRISLLASLAAVGLAMLIGIPLGALAGYKGGWIDNVIMRICDIFLSFPSLLLAIVIAAFAGPSLKNALIAIAISWWPWYARIVRGQAISLKERQFVRASRAIGNTQGKIIFQHIVPNCMAPVIVQASLDFGSIILTLASLSFLGLGAQAPTPEWGLMINTSKTYFLNAWWYSVFPGIAIFLAVLAFNLIGDGLREIMDPRTRNR